LVPQAIRQVALQALVDAADGRAGRGEVVLETDLGGMFIGDETRIPGLQVARAVHLLVQFVGGGRIEPAEVIAEARAERVAEGAVVSGLGSATAARDVAARAVDLAGGEVAAVLRAVLAGREEQVELRAAPVRRFIPDRVVEAGTEFHAVVAA